MLRLKIVTVDQQNSRSVTKEDEKNTIAITTTTTTTRKKEQQTEGKKECKLEKCRTTKKKKMRSDLVKYTFK